MLRITRISYSSYFKNCKNIQSSNIFQLIIFKLFLTSNINNAVLNSLDDSLLSNEEPLITSNNALQDIYYTLHSPPFYE